MYDELDKKVQTFWLGKGSKIKLIIFAEFSAKGVPHPPFGENNLFFSNFFLLAKNYVFLDTFTKVRTCGRGQHPGRMSRVGGGHNGEKNFIALFHVSEHSEHFKSILKN